jgi:poly-beta-hydroxyalkanoate depolymerase
MTANQQLIDDWLNCSTSSVKETQFLINDSLIDAIFKVLENLKSDEKVFNV